VHATLKDFSVDRESGQRVQAQIEAFLRHQVWSGRIKPGDRLPSTHELTRRWGVNLVSVQKAMERLTEWGLLERKTKMGTVVRPLTVAILPQPDLAQETVHYVRALTKAVRSEVESHGWIPEVYDDFQLAMKFDRVEESANARRFLADQAARRFAGAVMVAMTHATWALLAKRTPLPGVHCSQEYRTSDVMNDYYRFAYDSVEFLAKRGRRNLAILGFHENSEEYHAALAAAARFDLPRPRTHAFESDSTCLEQIAKETGGLIAGWRKEGRFPDALIVSDDIAMRGVALALIAKGVSVPVKLELVSQANSDVQIEYGLPVIRYAFTPKRNAEYALDLLWKKMVHEPLPDRPILLAGRFLES
jgi:DNA-binding transcriptional regulator YhcF (GntR family)